MSSIYPRPGSKPLSPSEVKEGDVLFCTYNKSVMAGHTPAIARKYLVLKVDKEPWAGPKVTCVILYSHRYKNPGEIVTLNLPTLPIDAWGMEV